jgi:hypothetical protein
VKTPGIVFTMASGALEVLDVHSVSFGQAGVMPRHSVKKSYTTQESPAEPLAKGRPQNGP